MVRVIASDTSLFNHITYMHRIIAHIRGYTSRLTHYARRDIQLE